MNKNKKYFYFILKTNNCLIYKNYILFLLIKNIKHLKKIIIGHTNNLKIILDK